MADGIEKNAQKPELLTNRYIIKLTWPIFVELALNLFVGIANTIMMSFVGMEAVSAVGLVDSLNVFINQIYFSVSQGATVVVSHKTGRGDTDGIKDTISQSLSLCFFVAVIMATLILVFKNQVFGLLFGSVEQRVLHDGLLYLTASAVTYPMIAISNVCAGTFRGSGDSRTSMLVALGMNCVNLLVSAVLIYGMKAGIYGAIGGMFSARFMNMAVMAVIMAKRYGPDVIFSRRIFRLRRDVLWPVLGIGIPSGVDSTIFQFGKLIVQTFVSGMGTAAIAANSIAGNLTNLTLLPGSACMSSLVVLTGQAWGAGRLDILKTNVRKMVLATTALLVLASVIVTAARPQLLDIYNMTGGERGIANNVLNVICIIQPLLWPLAFMIASSLRASGDAGFVMIFSVASMWLFRVLGSYVLGVWLGMGVVGVTLAMGADWACRIIVFLFRYEKGKWQDNLLPSIKEESV